MLIARLWGTQELSLRYSQTANNVNLCTCLNNSQKVNGSESRHHDQIIGDIDI